MLHAAYSVQDNVEDVKDIKIFIERAQLEEEELAVQKRLDRKRKQQELEEEQETQGQPTKVSATLKQQWKEHLGLKARICMKWKRRNM